MCALHEVLGQVELVHAIHTIQGPIHWLLSHLESLGLVRSSDQGVPVGQVYTLPSSGPGSLRACVVGRLRGASVRGEALYELFGNGGGLPCLSFVLEFNSTPSGFAEN